ncbi:MAG: ankyrin repeat domain-containing protein [Akkermansia sp.]|nr:ankyrin repeat domain-containing protein [Akkermansia sp.]
MKHLLTYAVMLCATAGAMDCAPSAPPTATVQTPGMADAELDRLKTELEHHVYPALIDRRYQQRLISLLRLIQQGAHTDVTYPETKGCTALHYACNLSHAPLVQWLVNHGACLDATSHRGATVDDCVGGPSAREIRSILRLARKNIESIRCTSMAAPHKAQRAAEQLQAALTGAGVDSLAYCIPQRDDQVRQLATTLYRYVRTTRQLPPGTEAGTLCGRMLVAVRGSNMQEPYFCDMVEKEVRAYRTAALSHLLEQEACFADILCDIPLCGNEESITISINPDAPAEPRIDILRDSNAETHPERHILLHFTGYVARPDKGNTRATLHPRPDTHWVSICNDTLAESIAHYTGHSAHVRYNTNRLELHYHPDGTPRHRPEPPSKGLPVYFRVLQK